MESEQLVKTICPRCNGNVYIRIMPVISGVFDKSTETDCTMCEEIITHMGQRITVHNGYVMLQTEHTRKNVEGGRESKIKWSGETLPEVGKE